MIIVAMGQQTPQLQDTRVSSLALLQFQHYNAHYIIVPELVFGRHCYTHRMHYLPQTVSVQAVFQLLAVFSF